MSLTDLAVRGAIQVMNEYVDKISRNPDPDQRSPTVRDARGMTLECPHPRENNFQRDFSEIATGILQQTGYERQDNCFHWFLLDHDSVGDYPRGEASFPDSEAFPDFCANDKDSDAYKKALNFFKLRDKCFLIGKYLRQIVQQCDPTNGKSNPFVGELCISLGNRLLETKLPTDARDVVAADLSDLEETVLRFKVALSISSILYYATGAFLFV